MFQFALRNIVCETLSSRLGREADRRSSRFFILFATIVPPVSCTTSVRVPRLIFNSKENAPPSNRSTGRSPPSATRSARNRMETTSPPSFVSASLNGFASCRKFTPPPCCANCGNYNKSDTASSLNTAPRDANGFQHPTPPALSPNENGRQHRRRAYPFVPQNQP
jgi:hypothetical protein